MTSEGPHDAGHDPAHSAPPVVRGAASVPGRAPDQADEADFPPQTLPSRTPMPPAAPPSFPGFKPAQADRDAHHGDAHRGDDEWGEPRGRRQAPDQDPNDYFAPGRADSAGGFPPIEPTQAFPPPSPEFSPPREFSAPHPEFSGSTEFPPPAPEFPPAREFPSSQSDPSIEELRASSRPAPSIEELRAPSRPASLAEEFRAPSRPAPQAEEFRASQGFPAAQEFPPPAQEAREQDTGGPDQPADRGFGPLERSPQRDFDGFPPPPATANREFGGFDAPRDDADREPGGFSPAQEATAPWSERARHSAEPGGRPDEQAGRPDSGLHFDGPAGYPEDAGPYGDEPGRYADPTNLPRRTPADPSSLPPKPERPAAVTSYPPPTSPMAAADSPAPGAPGSFGSGFPGARQERPPSAFSASAEDHSGQAGADPHQADPHQADPHQADPHRADPRRGDSHPADRPQRRERYEDADRHRPEPAGPLGHRDAGPDAPDLPSAAAGRRDRIPDSPMSVPQQRPPAEAAGDLVGRGATPATGRAVSASASVPVASRVSPQDGAAVLPQGMSAPQPRVYGTPTSPPGADPADRSEAVSRQFPGGAPAAHPQSPHVQPAQETPGRFPAGASDPRFPGAGSASAPAGPFGRPAVDRPGGFQPDEGRPGGFGPDHGGVGSGVPRADQPGGERDPFQPGGQPRAFQPDRHGSVPGGPADSAFPGGPADSAFPGGPADSAFPGGPPDHTRAAGPPPYAEMDASAAPPRPAGGVYGTAAAPGHPGYPGGPAQLGHPAQPGHSGGPGQPGQPDGFPAAAPYGAMIPNQPTGPSGGWPADDRFDGRIDDPSFGEDRSDGAAPEPEPVPQVRNGRVLLAVLSGAALLLVLPFLIVWMATRNSADPGFEVGSCVKESGSTAVAVDCGDGGAFRVVSKVADKAECPDRNQPSLLMPDSNGRDRVLCLRPANS